MTDPQVGKVADILRKHGLAASAMSAEGMADNIVHTKAVYEKGKEEKNEVNGSSKSNPFSNVPMIGS